MSHLEVVILNPRSSDGDGEYLVGHTIMGVETDPDRIVFDDGRVLFIRDVERDDDGRLSVVRCEWPPVDASAN